MYVDHNKIKHKYIGIQSNTLEHPNKIQIYNILSSVFSNPITLSISLNEYCSLWFFMSGCSRVHITDEYDSLDISSLAGHIYVLGDMRFINLRSTSSFVIMITCM